MPLCRREDATAGHGRWGGAINDIIAFDNIFCLSQKGGRNEAARARQRGRVGRCPLRGFLCVGIGRIKTPSKGIGWGFPLWGTGGGSTGWRWRGTGAAAGKGGKMSFDGVFVCGYWEDKNPIKGHRVGLPPLGDGRGLNGQL